MKKSYILNANDFNKETKQKIAKAFNKYLKQYNKDESITKDTNMTLKNFLNDEKVLNGFIYDLQKYGLITTLSNDDFINDYNASNETHFKNGLDIFKHEKTLHDNHVCIIKNDNDLICIEWWV